MQQTLTKKTDTRFRYNLGVYQIRVRMGDTWQQIGPEIGGSFSKCLSVMEKLQTADPESAYALFYLDQSSSGSIEWKRASRDDHYFSQSREEIQKILYQLKLPLGNFGFSKLSEITNISKASIQNMLRQPEDPRFQSISQEGMLYIRYRVQEALKERSHQSE